VISLHPDARALEIFGVRALVTRAGTRFRDVDLDGLTLDMMVELSGLVNGDGALEVTHLRRRRDPIVGVSEVKTFGEVTGLAGGSFVLGTSEILFDRTTIIDDFGPSGLRDGLRVRVEGILLANDAIQASEIESLRRDRDDRFAETEIQGIVSDFVSIADFRVADRPVDASGATLEPNDPDLLRDGVRVEAEGRVNASGVLVARKLKFRSNRVRIDAEIASDDDIDLANGRLWLLDVPIDLDRRMRLRDQRDGLDGFGPGDLQAGDFIGLRGLARSDGTVTATRLERDDHDDLEIRGPVDMIEVSERRFTILGVLIHTDSRTLFRSNDGAVLSESEFYGRLRPGVVVEAKDEEDGDETDFDVANEVEIEEPELIDRDEDDGESGSDDGESGSSDD